MTGADGAAVFFAADDFFRRRSLRCRRGLFRGRSLRLRADRREGNCANQRSNNYVFRERIAVVFENKRAAARGSIDASELESVRQILLLNWLGRVGIFAEGFRIALAEHFHHPMIKIIDAVTEYRLKPAFIFFTCLPDFIF